MSIKISSTIPIFSILRELRCIRRHSSISRGIKLLFPGQGSQYVGMTTRLEPLCSGAQEVFSVASSVLGYDLRELCINGPDEQLQDTLRCQPAVVVGSLAMLEQMKFNDSNVMGRCIAMAGFSVGEITALIASKAVDLDKGLELVKLRATLMQKACQENRSGMVTIIGLTEETVAALCIEAEQETKGTASIANYLFPKGIVVSADEATLDVVSRKATMAKQDVTVKRVNVSGAFHSSLMSSALVEMKNFLDSVEFRLPSCYHVYSNATGTPYPFGNVGEVRELLAQQIISPVRWEQCMNHLIDNHGTEHFIEIGPGKQLKAMLKRINRAAFRNTTSMEV